MRCIICGKEMVNTTGGNYHCPSCGQTIHDLINRPSNYDMPLSQGFGKQEGWICPVCGRGVAPWVSYCPCQSDWKIAYGTSTDGTYDTEEYLKQIGQYNTKQDEDLLEG